VLPLLIHGNTTVKIYKTKQALHIIQLQLEDGVVGVSNPLQGDGNVKWEGTSKNVRNKVGQGFNEHEIHDGVACANLQ
jgi:hypothetical protein